jgi:hypothetical protein
VQDFKYIKIIQVAVVVILVLVLLFPQSLAAQQKQTEKSDEETTEPVYPKKVRSRATWEYIVNIPGYILYFPFWLVYSIVMPILGWVERSNIIPRINDFLTSDDGNRKTFPIFESQYGLGLIYSHKNLFKPGCELEMTGMMGLWWRRYFSAELTSYRLGGPLVAGVGGRYQLWTDTTFFGIGNDSSKDDRSNFAHRQPAFWGSLGLDLGPKTKSVLAFRFEKNSVSEGRNPNIPSTTDWPDRTGQVLPGLESRVDFFTIDLDLEHFSLIQQENAAGGWEIRAGATMYNQMNGNAFNFYKGSLDVKRYIHLFYGRMLSLRFATEITRPFKDGEIPFYYLSSLGQRKTIRGYFRGRYQDRDFTLFSAEYRYPMIKRRLKLPSVEAMLFVDLGKVSPDIFKESLFRNYHTSFGGGIRIFNQTNLNLQLILAKSSDGFRFYLVLNKK